ncbi:hypothetical protein A2U01_0056550, partial [Trifolium medium]|nr:hypothetical protein [Trifolium medium]
GLFIVSLCNETGIVPATAEEKGSVMLIESGLGLDSPAGHDRPPAAG